MKKTFASLLLFLTTMVLACGSEPGLQTQDIPPTVDVPPGLPGPEKKPIVVDVLDPDFDAGTGEQDDSADGDDVDAGDGGTTDPTDGGTTDPDDGVDGGPPATVTLGGVKVEYKFRRCNTFCYKVTELLGAKDLSHWRLGTTCKILDAWPKSGFSVDTDPNSGDKSVKWRVNDDFESGLFCVIVTDDPALGMIDVTSKSGFSISHGTIVGPVCQ